jgi:hypothetical protein
MDIHTPTENGTPSAVIREEAIKAADLAERIVDTIRTRATNIREEDSDPWDELSNGVAWLDNEFSPAFTCFPRLEVVVSCSDVSEVQRLLADLNADDLAFIHYIVTNGGTDTFCDMEPDQILELYRQSPSRFIQAGALRVRITDTLVSFAKCVANGEYDEEEQEQEQELSDEQLRIVKDKVNLIIQYLENRDDLESNTDFIHEENDLFSELITDADQYYGDIFGFNGNNRRSIFTIQYIAVPYYKCQ